MGRRTTKLLSSSVARSSRAAVSRTMFSLSRMRFLCTKVKRYERTHNECVVRRTAFLTSHVSSSLPAIYDSVAKHTALSLSRDSASPLAAAAAAIADVSRFLFPTISVLYSASSFWYLQVSCEVTRHKEGCQLIIFRHAKKSHTNRFTTPVLILSCLRVASVLLLILAGSQS
jgi:hypothetical protein